MLPSDARLVRTALRDVILGDAAHANAAARALHERRFWPVAIPLSGQWRMTPAVHDRLTRSDDLRAAAGLDDAAIAELRTLTVVASAQSAFAVARAREALTLLERDGVEAIAIKGIALIAGLYGHRSMRMVGDLDVLIAEDAYPAALACLERSGYVDDNLALERHLADIALSPRVHNIARNLKRDGFEVDVHWQFGANPPAALRSDRIIARARTASLGGTIIRVAAPADAMAIGAHHALRGYFGTHETVKDAYDLAAWWRLKPDAFDLGDVLQTAFDSEVATALCALWMVVAQRSAGHPCECGIAAFHERFSRRERREAAALTAFCDEQFERGARAERTVQLFDGGALARSFAGHGKRVVVGAPPDGLAREPVARRPLAQRAGGAIGRIGRVARELLRLRAHGTYRALARAQSRLR